MNAIGAILQILAVAGFSRYIHHSQRHQHLPRSHSDKSVQDGGPLLLDRLDRLH